MEKVQIRHHKVFLMRQDGVPASIWYQRGPDTWGTSLRGRWPWSLWPAARRLYRMATAKNGFVPGFQHARLDAPTAIRGVSPMHLNRIDTVVRTNGLASKPRLGDGGTWKDDDWRTLYSWQSYAKMIQERYGVPLTVVNGEPLLVPPKPEPSDQDYEYDEFYD